MASALNSSISRDVACQERINAEAFDLQAERHRSTGDIAMAEECERCAKLARLQAAKAEAENVELNMKEIK